MARELSFEAKLLFPINSLIDSYSLNYEERLSILEIVVARYFKINIYDYWEKINFHPKSDTILQDTKNIVNAILDFSRPNNFYFSLYIAALARRNLTVDEEKKEGVFYTDFRLANHLAKECENYITETVTISDLSAGTGILLCAVGNTYKKLFPNNIDTWLENNVFAYELSAEVTRGTLLSLFALSGNLNIIESLKSNITVCDSLLNQDKRKFDLIIGNPPWGKIKLSKYQYQNRNGIHSSYGTQYDNLNEDGFSTEKDSLRTYVTILQKNYNLSISSEIDSYMLFLEKGMGLLKNQGHLCFYIPAGIIRSKNTFQLRKELMTTSNNLVFSVFNNKNRYFSIDSRFKFVMVSYNKTPSKCVNKVSVAICKDTKEIEFNENIEFSLSELKNLRADLSLPELRNNSEKDLFFKIANNSSLNSNNTWGTNILREVDMTNSRSKFKKLKTDKTDIPLVEGRMVQNLRFGAKSYISGEGRSAVWEPTNEHSNPQFYISLDDLSESLKERMKAIRVGFCDIAGQTNERSMMSSLIPQNYICGNKVPTISFLSQDEAYLWLGVTNSFIFDWLLRRVLTTTVNYFLLLSIPFPNFENENEIKTNIIELVKNIESMDSDFYTNREMEINRAKIDAYVATAYKLTLEDIIEIMNDFPLIDKKQKAINSENKSTITKDLFIAEFMKINNITDIKYRDRYEKAVSIGARAYIPSEMVSLCH